MMYTIFETPAFSAQWLDYWSPEEFGEFCSWLAVHPEAGDVIPKSGGCRKVRWSVPGRGKRGGGRVIYFNRLEQGYIWLLVMYAKNARTNIDGRVLAKVRETIDAKND